MVELYKLYELYNFINCNWWRWGVSHPRPSADARWFVYKLGPLNPAEAGSVALSSWNGRENSAEFSSQSADGENTRPTKSQVMTI